MHEVLKSGGTDITERSLRTFLDKGVLPGRKVAEAARAMVSEVFLAILPIPRIVPLRHLSQPAASCSSASAPFGANTAG